MRDMQAVVHELMGGADYDPQMRPPPDVEIGLKAVKSTFRLRYNRQGEVVGERSLDVNGNARHVTYRPRWELWDTDASGNDYCVMVLRDEHGLCAEPGHWLVERMRKYNPQNFKSLQAMLDFFASEREALKRIPEREWRDFTDFMGEWCWEYMHPVFASAGAGRPIHQQ